MPAKKRPRREQTDDWQKIQLRQMKRDKQRTHLVADRSGDTGKTRRNMFCLWGSKLLLLDRDLNLCHKLCLIATTLIFKAEFPIGAADVIAIAFNPCEKSVVGLLYGAETAVMDHRGHRLHGREFDHLHHLAIREGVFK